MSTEVISGMINLKAGVSGNTTLTVHFIDRYLSKNVQVRSVEHPAEDPIRTGVVGVEQRLIGHSVGRQPHRQEKQEEENVLHLEERDEKRFVDVD